MRYLLISVVFVLIPEPLLSLAKPPSRWEDMHTMHSWNVIPADWRFLGHPPTNITIDLYVALKPYHENALINALYEVSVPGHPKYGAHLSREQVAELVAPHPDTFKLVKTWLDHYGVPSPVSLTHGGSTLTLTGVSVTAANDLLGASYQIYRHIETNETVVRTVRYALPAALHGHVLSVSPTTEFGIPRMQWQTPGENSGGEAAGPATSKSASGEPVTALSKRGFVATPMVLRWLYKTLAYKPIALDKNVLGVVGFRSQWPSPTDLTEFMLKYRSDGVAATYRVQLVNNGEYDPTHPSREPNLDVQYTEAIAFPTPIIFYSTGPGPPHGSEWLLSWLGYILDQEAIPQTISVSYNYQEKLVSRKYAEDVCDKFAQLGLRGVSVLFSSGDDGVGRGDCKTTDGSVQFAPRFPATCPYVTTVGGTTARPEVAARFSGGGFSNYFERPLYQQQAVPTFFQDVGGLSGRYRGLFNDSGRGIPDIAAQARGFPVFLSGQEKFLYGTSGSAPIVASIISLLNDHRLSNGKAPLGFLNPWLYGSGRTGLNDITKGSNPGCGTRGFSAVTGWDPVTGLGTPNFEELLSKSSTYVSQIRQIALPSENLTSCAST